MSTLDVTNPYTLEKFESVPMQTNAEAMEMLTRASKAFHNRSQWLPDFEKIEILQKTKDILFKKRESLIETAVLEGGKPYADSAVEIDRGLTGIEVAIREISGAAGREIPMSWGKKSYAHQAYTTHQPRGPVVSISAFNHPFNLAIHQIIPALAAGCPVIIKPAGDTPLSARRLVDALHEAGLPKEWCQYIVCENDVAEALVTDARTQFLSFIGSAKVGWSLRSKLAPGTTCALEHGGAAPAIIDASADLEKIIPGVVRASYYHAGQVCVSTQRIYVHKEIEKKFMDAFLKEIQKLKTGNPLDKDTDCGPIIRTKELERIESWVNEAKDEGADLLLGGKRVGSSCYAPTVLLNPKETSKVSTQEVFGPVSCVYSFDDLGDAIKRANQLDFAFQASIYSNDVRSIQKAANELEGLAIMVNEHTAFRVDWMPFGGYKNSGLGVGGIGYSMRDMQIEKMIVIKDLEA